MGLWFKADAGTGTTVQSATVTTWLDYSGNAKNATSVGAPKFTINPAGMANFNPGIYFNGITDGYNLPLSTLTVADENYSFYGVIKNYLSKDIQVVAFTGSNSTNRWFRLHIDANGSINDRFNVVGVNNSPPGAILLSTPVMFSAHYNTTDNDKETFVNGISVAKLTGVGDKNTNNVNQAIGYNPIATTEYYEGNFHEIIAYKSDLSVADFNKVNSYLAVKYGLTLGTKGSPISYVSSNGTIFWNNTAFHSDVAGIGSDDKSSLNQKQSKSVN